jgi:hypothetical protein
MEKSVRVAEREYSKKMAALSREFDVRTILCLRMGPILRNRPDCCELVLGNGEPDERR